MRTSLILCICLCVCLPTSLAMASHVGQDEVYGTNVLNDPRRGSVHKYEDPMTGDKVISVRPGQKKKEESVYTNSPMPIYVLPQISPKESPVSPPVRP